MADSTRQSGPANAGRYYWPYYWGVWNLTPRDEKMSHDEDEETGTNYNEDEEQTTDLAAELSPDGNDTDEQPDDLVSGTGSSARTSSPVTPPSVGKVPVVPILATLTVFVMLAASHVLREFPVETGKAVEWISSIDVNQAPEWDLVSWHSDNDSGAPGEGPPPEPEDPQVIGQGQEQADADDRATPSNLEEAADPVRAGLPDMRPAAHIDRLRSDGEATEAIASNELSESSLIESINEEFPMAERSDPISARDKAGVLGLTLAGSEVNRDQAGIQLNSKQVTASTRLPPIVHSDHGESADKSSGIDTVDGPGRFRQVPAIDSLALRNDQLTESGSLDEFENGDRWNVRNASLNARIASLERRISELVSRLPEQISARSSAYVSPGRGHDPPAGSLSVRLGAEGVAGLDDANHLPPESSVHSASLPEASTGREGSTGRTSGFESVIEDQLREYSQGNVDGLDDRDVYRINSALETCGLRLVEQPAIGDFLPGYGFIVDLHGDGQGGRVVIAENGSLYLD